MTLHLKVIEFPKELYSDNDPVAKPVVAEKTIEDVDDFKFDIRECEQEVCGKSVKMSVPRLTVKKTDGRCYIIGFVMEIRTDGIMDGIEFG
jgi:hypothetical protein